MTQSDPILCTGCGRANTSSAKRCLWCGAPLIVEGTVPFFEPTQADLDYLGGIERLHDPTAVRVTVSEAGIEITETMPGSRKITIGAADVVDVQVSGSGRVPDVLQRPWWGKLRRSVFHKARVEEIPRAQDRDFTLTIRYRENDVVQSAVFHRLDGQGLFSVQVLARAAASLVRLRVLRSESHAEASEV